MADFGLSRATVARARAQEGDDIDATNDDRAAEYYRSHSGTLPVRWTSPEAIETMKFTQASDVWSFGVTLLEIFTDGATPYPDFDNHVVVTLVLGGYRAPLPERCPPAVHGLMLWCWHQNQTERPDFPAIVKHISRLIASSQDSKASTVLPSNRVTRFQEKIDVSDVPTSAEKRHDYRRVQELADGRNVSDGAKAIPQGVEIDEYRRNTAYLSADDAQELNSGSGQLLDTDAHMRDFVLERGLGLAETTEVAAGVAVAKSNIKAGVSKAPEPLEQPLPPAEMNPHVAAVLDGILADNTRRTSEGYVNQRVTYDACSEHASGRHS